MLSLVQEIIPLARINSLCIPKNLKFIGTVQHLTSRPENVYIHSLFALDNFLFILSTMCNNIEYVPGNFSFHPQ